MSLTETSSLAPQPTGSLGQPPVLQKGGLKLPKSTSFNMFGKDGFTFFDMLDIINPLQHLPGISFLYRKITGDTIDPGSRIIGGTILGGPIGAIANLTDVMLQQETGKDLAESARSLFLAKEQKEGINLYKTNTANEEFGHETLKKNASHVSLNTPDNNDPRNKVDQGMSAIPISNVKNRGRDTTSFGRNDPPELFASIDTSRIDKINLETRFLEKQAFISGKTTITPSYRRNHLNSANPLNSHNKKQVFENSMLSGLQKYHATIKLGGSAHLGHETLKITR